jgi:dihydroorotate dehydrogenase (NAD+) catalytic subunit
MAELKKPDLSVKIGQLKLKNPLITASGTYGYADEYDEYVNLCNVGAIITKGMTLNPRQGNPQPRIKEVQGGMINCIGLENMGIYDFIKYKLPVLTEKNITFIVNIAGSDISEYAKLAKICLDSGIYAIELNLSCPNVTSGCIEFGKDKDILYNLVSSVREVFDKTLIVKLSSNVSNPVELAVNAEKAGADAISAINTVKAMSVEARINNKKLDFKYVKGGLSGSCIKPIALGFINEISQAINIPIIGMGGISSVSDIFEFMAVGSSAVQIGTANFTHPYICDQLEEDLTKILLDNGVSSLQELLYENSRKH